MDYCDYHKNEQKEAKFKCASCSKLICLACSKTITAHYEHSSSQKTYCVPCNYERLNKKSRESKFIAYFTALVGIGILITSIIGLLPIGTSGLGLVFLILGPFMVLVSIVAILTSKPPSEAREELNQFNQEHNLPIH